MTLASEGEEWGTITITSDEGKKVEQLKPSNKDKVYSLSDKNEVKEYLDNIDAEGFAKNVSDISGFDITADDVNDFIDDMMNSTSDFSDDLNDTDNNYYDDWDDTYSDYYDFDSDDIEDLYGDNFDDLINNYQDNDFTFNNSIDNKSSDIYSLYGWY